MATIPCRSGCTPVARVAWAGKVEAGKGYILFLKGSPKKWSPAVPHVWFLPKDESVLEEMRRLRPGVFKERDAGSVVPADAAERSR